MSGARNDGAVLLLEAGAAATLPAAYLGDKVGMAIDSMADPLAELSELPMRLLAQIAGAPLSLSFDPIPLICLLVAAALPWCAVMGLLMTTMTNTRKGEEHGSARWADPKELAPFRDSKNPDPEDNTLLLTENVGMAVSREGYDQSYERNLNVLVIGGSGSGKTRYYVKPNVAQMNTDYFITDPKGSLVKDVGQMLVDGGYSIRSFNTFKPEKSMRYNPLHYVRTDLEIISFAKLLIEMTTGTGNKSSDPFWEKSEAQLYMALIAFMRDYLPEREYHIGTLLRLLGMAEVKEDKEDYESPLDIIFKEIETGYRLQAVKEVKRPRPNRAQAAPAAADAAEERVFTGNGAPKTRKVPSRYRRKSDGKRPYDNVKSNGSRGFEPGQDFALENYKKFKIAAGKTLKSIIISCNVRLAPFTAAEVKKITCGEDEMHLEDFGDKDSKNALFCIFEDVDQKTLGFLHGLMVYQAIKVLCAKAETMRGDRLPRCVNFLLDEYFSLNLPESISAAVSVIRSRNIAMSIILQGLSQLDQLYQEKAASTIKACCDTLLFLGSQEESTRKYISDMCGQMTVLDENYSSSHGQSGSWSKSNSKIARQLIDAAEVGKLDNSKAIVAIRAADPCIDSKYPLERHPRYGQMREGGFDIVKYWQERGVEAAGAGNT